MKRLLLPRIKVNGGQIAINRPAREALGDPERVQFTSPKKGVLHVKSTTDPSGKKLNSSFICSATHLILEIGLRQGVHNCTIRGNALTIKFDPCNTWRDEL